MDLDAGQRNLHRNVIFKDTKKVPDVAVQRRSIRLIPRICGAWMDAQREAGNELLAISHNANLCDGIMFPLDVDSKGRPIDAAWAQDADEQRAAVGDHASSRARRKRIRAFRPTTSSPTSKFLNYLLGGVDRAPRIHGSYIREAYQNGLGDAGCARLQPVQIRASSARATRTTPSSRTQQSNYFGGHGLLDATPQGALERKGVSRSRTWLALRRVRPRRRLGRGEHARVDLRAPCSARRPSAPAGPRIKVRLFGGWDFAPDVLKQKDWVKTGYANGVPMGGDLPPPKGKAPTFIVWAVKDPDDANLDRIQIVKGWTKNGQTFEKIYDVAWSGDRKRHADSDSECSFRRQRTALPPVGNTVDVKNATYDKHDRRGRVEDRMDGPGIRSEPACLLLRPGSADPDTALDHLRRQELWACRLRATCLQPFRIAPGLRRSGTRRLQKCVPSAPHGLTVAELMQRGATALDDAAVAPTDRRQDRERPQHGEQSAL